MSRWPRARRWILTSLPLLAVFAPLIWSQRVEPAEFQKFHQDALREIFRTQNLDPAVVQSVRKAFQPGSDRLLDKSRAAASLTEELKRRDLGLKRDNGAFEVHLAPRDGRLDLSARTSLDFVDSLSSVIRRLSILDQLGPGRSSPIEQDQLPAYLRDSMKVTDYEQVAKSFAPGSRVEVLTFPEPKTLWRIYGGGSGPVGRYFFCCLIEGVPDDPRYWVDASGLAMPRENLRQHLAGVKVPAGSTVLVGTVADNFADQFGRLEKGGNTQIFIPHVQGFPFDEYRKIAESNQILFGPVPQLKKPKQAPALSYPRIARFRSEIMVQSDDRILRFRGPDSTRLQN